MYFEKKEEEVYQVKPVFMRKPAAAFYLGVKGTKIEDMFKDRRLTKCYIDSCVVVSVKQMDSLHDNILNEFRNEVLGVKQIWV